MRFFINTVLFLLIAFGIGFLVYENSQIQGDVVARPNIALELKTSQSEQAQIISKVAGDEGAVDERCFAFGPFNNKELVRIQPTLKQFHLMQYTKIVDRYLPDQWIVYLGRFNNETAVRAFMKQFRQQGIKSARPILRGDLSYGVEVAAFATQQDALRYLTSSSAPAIQGMRVTNRLGEPSDQVDILFQELDENARSRLFTLWKKYPSKELKNCGFIER